MFHYSTYLSFDLQLYLLPGRGHKHLINKWWETTSLHINEKKLSEKKPKEGEHIKELICRTPGIKVTFTQSHRWQSCKLEEKKKKWSTCIWVYNLGIFKFFFTYTWIFKNLNFFFSCPFLPTLVHLIGFCTFSILISADTFYSYCLFFTSTATCFIAPSYI